MVRSASGSISSLPSRMARAERGETAGASATARKAEELRIGGGTGRASVVSQAVASSMGDSTEGLKEASDMTRGVKYEVVVSGLFGERPQLGQRRNGEGLTMRDGEGGQGKRVLSTSSRDGSVDLGGEQGCSL